MSFLTIQELLVVSWMFILTKKQSIVRIKVYLTRQKNPKCIADMSTTSSVFLKTKKKHIYLRKNSTDAQRYEIFYTD